MRLSLKESRMKLLNAITLDRKSGIRGTKTMGEAHHSFLFSTATTEPTISVNETDPAAPNPHPLAQYSFQSQNSFLPQ